MVLTEGKSTFVENRIKRKFAFLKQTNKKGLIAFITAGDPDYETTIKLAREIEKAGADILELGVPYSDPLADGPIIQKASLRALEKGMDLAKIFHIVRRIRQESELPLILMSYYNPLLKYGLNEFALEAACVGVDGVIVPDLPLEENAALEKVLQEKGLYLVPLIAPTSGRERIGSITKGEKGFVYCVSLTGVTGIRDSLPEGLKDFMASARQLTVNPLAVGFGVSNPEQAREIAIHSDAVIVGSALVKTIEDNLNAPTLLEKVGTFVSSLRRVL